MPASHPHMKPVPAPKRSGLYAAVVILLAVAAAIPLWYFSKGAESTKAQQLLNKEDAKVIRSNDGQRGSVTMEDSVVVHMGSATTVKYTKSYPLDARGMQIIGVAAMKAPKLDSPLLVKIGNAWVYANDAEFVGRSFPEDSNAAMLKVLSGTISVHYGQDEKSLAAGKTMLVLNNGTFMDLDESRAKLLFNWLDGQFVAVNQPLGKVLSEFKKWYALDVSTKDVPFLERPVSMTAPLDSAKVAIKALEDGAAIKITLVGVGKGTLTDNAANVKVKK